MQTCSGLLPPPWRTTCASSELADIKKKPILWSIHIEVLGDGVQPIRCSRRLSWNTEGGRGGGTSGQKSIGGATHVVRLLEGNVAKVVVHERLQVVDVYYAACGRRGNMTGCWAVSSFPCGIQFSGGVHVHPTPCHILQNMLGRASSGFIVLAKRNKTGCCVRVQHVSLCVAVAMAATPSCRNIVRRARMAARSFRSRSYSSMLPPGRRCWTAV